jgi:hypothetical protein
MVVTRLSLITCRTASNCSGSKGVPLSGGQQGRAARPRRGFALRLVKAVRTLTQPGDLGGF